MGKSLAVILVIIGFVILAIGLFYTSKIFRPMHFNLIAGLIALLVTGFALFGKLLQDKVSLEKSDKILQTGQQTNQKIDTLENQNQELKEKLENQQQTIKQLRDENTELHLKVAKISSEIYSNITGGNSYCVVYPAFSYKGTEFYIMLIGDTPLRDVQISIDDIGRRRFLTSKMNISHLELDDKKKVDELFKVIPKTQYFLSLESVYPNIMNFISIPVEKEQEEVDLLIRINQPNGKTEQLLEIKNLKSPTERKVNISLTKDGVKMPTDWTKKNK